MTGAQPACQAVKPATQASLVSPGLAAHGVTPSVAAGSSVNSPGAKIKPCVLCRQSHGLQQCENFKGLSPKACFDVVRSHKLCFNCFRDNHQARACFKKSQCSVPNCKLKHSELLHVGDNERMNNDQTAHGTRGKQSADSSHVNCGGTNTHLPLVCSEIWARYHPNPTPDRWPLESLPLGSETGIQVTAVVGIGDHLGRQLPVSLLVPVSVASVDTTLLPTKF